MADLIAVGEPLVELAAESAGSLGDVKRFRCGWGGDTANCVLAAARLGGACGYVTRVGDDEFGHAFIAMLERGAVDASQVRVDAEHHTGVYFVSYTDERQHQFTYLRRDSPAAISIPPMSVVPASCMLEHNPLTHGRILQQRSSFRTRPG